MNALDVLVTPRPAGGATGAADAAPVATDADATAGAFIALLGAMLGATPVVELKPTAPMSLLAGGEPAPDGEALPSDGEPANGDLVATPTPAAATTGTALVSDSELVGIARAALAIMKRNAAASKAANAAGCTARPTLTVPLAQLARNAARKAEHAAGEPTKVQESTRKVAEVVTPEVESAAADSSATTAVPAIEAAAPVAAPAALVAEALSAATAAVRAPAANEADGANGDATQDAGRAMTSQRASTPATPLTWTPAPSAAIGGATGTAQDSALVDAVTQLIDALMQSDAATSSNANASTALVTPDITVLPDAASSANQAAQPGALVVEGLQVARSGSTHDVKPSAKLPLESARIVESLVPSMDSGEGVPANANQARSAVPQTIAVDGPTLDAGDALAPTAPKDAARPREVAAAPLSTAAKSHSGEREGSSRSQSESKREHDRPAPKATGVEATSHWSSSTHSSATPTVPASDSKAAVVTDVAVARSPDEPTRAPQPTSHVTLQLDKDTLGASRIRVAVRGDTVRATILADDTKAAALSAQLPELRRALEDRGFTEARVVIQVEGHQDHQGTVIAGAVTDDLRARPAASARTESGREEQQPRGGRRQDPDGDRPRDRRRQAPKEEAQ